MKQLRTAAEIKAYMVDNTEKFNKNAKMTKKEKQEEIKQKKIEEGSWEYDEDPVEEPEEKYQLYEDEDDDEEAGFIFGK
jgi:hypothetical protein